MSKLHLSAGKAFFMDGRLQAVARDEWLDSPEGKNCRVGSASGQYLDNRLRLAFSAGIDAALRYLRSANTTRGK